MARSRKSKANKRVPVKSCMPFNVGDEVTLQIGEQDKAQTMYQEVISITDDTCMCDDGYTYDRTNGKCLDPDVSGYRAIHTRHYAKQITENKD